MKQNLSLSLKGRDLTASSAVELSKEDMAVRLFSSEVKLSRKKLLT